MIGVLEHTPFGSEQSISMCLRAVLTKQTSLTKEKENIKLNCYRWHPGVNSPKLYLKVELLKSFHFNSVNNKSMQFFSVKKTHQYIVVLLTVYWSQCGWIFEVFTPN